MKRIYKLSYFFIFIFVFCKPTIDRSNYPLIFSLFNSKNTNTTAFSLSYSQVSFSLPINIAITAISPTTSGTISSCSVTPSLPSGLILSNSCSISGTPTVDFPLTSFTITATNSSSSAVTVIQIEVLSSPFGLSYLGSYTFTIGTGITTITPTVSGIVTSYSINISLPSGLNFDTTTGQISGTPSALSPTTSYTVTASNESGNDTFSFSIMVADVAPTSFSYTGSPFSFTEYQTISTITPSITGNIVNCSSTPSLPTGLSLSGTTCQITGMPTVVQANTNYTILASNSGGSVTTTINIAVVINPNKKIFVTNITYTPGANFTSPAGADTICNADSGKPLGSGTYKAMIVAPLARVACSTANCGTLGNLEHLDWIFQPSTTYYQNDGVTPIATTDGLGLMPATFTNAVNPAHSKYWTGLEANWTTSSNNCSSWASNATNSTCGGYNTNNISSNFISSPDWGIVSCGAAQQLLCVQQ